MSQLQGQDRNIICFAIFSFSMNHFILLVLDSAALSFRYILLEWCNCTMTGPIPLPHQSLCRRYGRPLNMTTPAPPPPRSVSTFMLMLINNRISAQLTSAKPGFPGPHPPWLDDKSHKSTAFGLEHVCLVEVLLVTIFGEQLKGKTTNKNVLI